MFKVKTDFIKGYKGKDIDYTVLSIDEHASNWRFCFLELAIPRKHHFFIIRRVCFHINRWMCCR